MIRIKILKLLKVLVPLAITIGITFAEAQLSSVGFHKGVASNSVTFSGGGSGLTFISPVHNGGAAPVALSPAIPYDVYSYTIQAFQVLTTGNYTISGVQNSGSTTIFLYSGSFDPTLPLSNCVSSAVGNTSIGPISLSTGTNYFVVTTGGLYLNSISGAGQVVLMSAIGIGFTSACPASTAANVLGIPPPLANKIEVYSDSTCSSKISTSDESPARMLGEGIPILLPNLNPQAVYSKASITGYGAGPCVPHSTTCYPIKAGDGPVTQTVGGQWVAAWIKSYTTDAYHKADFTNLGTSWTIAKYTNLIPTTLAGGDLYNGDIGVSGQNAVTSTIKQEIDGKEALKASVKGLAKKITVDLSNFYANDDGTTYSEAGLIQGLDANGGVLVEQPFYSTDAAGGTGQVVITSATGFSSFVILTGCYNGATFVHGAYCTSTGTFGSAIYTDGGGTHGSEFLLNWYQFEFQ